jgi:tRNA 5-methylaminomethyl-2-thiouridine biosynthesis bifunctional protein
MTSAIVIGGGIAGCSAAYALAKRDIKVTLIERHAKLASEASGNPLAALYPKLGLNHSLANALTLRGFEFTLQLLQSLPTESTICTENPLFEACGQIQLGFNEREQSKQVVLANLYQLPLLSADEASGKAGIPLKTGGLFLPQAGWVKPVALCEALCSEPNISICHTTEALNIQKQANLWRVLGSNKNAFEADIVVICNANDIKQFKQCTSAEITPVRGQINAFKQTLICSDHYLSPAVDGWHVIGTTYAPNDMNANISDADTRENLNALRAMSASINQNIDIGTIQARVAWRSQTRDYMPLAGQLIDEEKLRKAPPRYNANPADLPWLEGLFVNAGHGSKGMITAPICAELIANLATKNTPNTSLELASKLNPSRFLLRELGLKKLANTLYKID